LSLTLKAFCHKLQRTVSSVWVPLLFSSFHVSRKQFPCVKVCHPHESVLYTHYSKHTICQHTTVSTQSVNTLQ
jgi:hypothetical protein